MKQTGNLLLAATTQDVKNIQDLVEEEIVFIFRMLHFDQLWTKNWTWTSTGSITFLNHFVRQDSHLNWRSNQLLPNAISLRVFSVSRQTIQEKMKKRGKAIGTKVPMNHHCVALKKNWRSPSVARKTKFKPEGFFFLSFMCTWSLPFFFLVFWS